MRVGLITSVIIHAAILLWITLAHSAKPLNPARADSILVELLSPKEVPPPAEPKPPNPAPPKSELLESDLPKPEPLKSAPLKPEPRKPVLEADPKPKPDPDPETTAAASAEDQTANAARLAWMLNLPVAPSSTGLGAHLVTVNSYLARRDSQWMGHVYRYLGLTVGCLDDTEPGSPERHAVYACDITYGTNNEFGFDYLRDNMVASLEQRVQRRHVFAIVDEVDSVLIDEARTPLIISGPVGNESDAQYGEHNASVSRLVRARWNQLSMISRWV